MEKEFVPYEQVLALKELGFDEPCYAIYDRKEQLHPFVKFSVMNNVLKIENDNEFTPIAKCLAPTYSQSFRWIRKRCNILAIVSYCDDNSGKFMAVIDKINGYIDYDMNPKNTYEEAELECLKQLIKIIKQNDN